MWNNLIELTEKFKDWFIANSTSPLFWIIIIVIILAIFEIVYKSLNER